METHSVRKWWRVCWGLDEFRDFGSEQAAEDFAYTLRLRDAYDVRVLALVDEEHIFPEPPA